MSTPSEALRSVPPAALREIGDLPCPPGLPWLGNTLQIDKPHVHLQVEGWARRYGHFFTISIGGHRLLVIADHKAMGAVLRDRPEGFRRTPRFASIAREIGLGSGVFGAEGEAWKRQRKMVMAGFDPCHLRAYFPALVRVCDRLEGRWQRAAAAGSGIDLQADLMRFTVDAIAGLAFGAEVNTLESDDDIIQRHLDKIFPAMFRRLFAPFPTWRWFRTRADRELDASVVKVNAAIDGFVGAARGRLDADPARRAAPANLLEAMIVAADDPGSGITDREVSGNVMTMLLAGEDTTANTLAWAIWLLFGHPESLARARAEIDAVAGDPSAWTHERFAAMSWLEACANETMRLKPVAPSLTLLALRDTVVADIRVPAGTLVFGALRSDSLREEYFARAGEFDPQRWLDPGAGPGASSASRVSMPFGAGPRVCPGRQLAMLEMKMALATLIGRFDIERVGTQDGREPEERMSFAMGPAGLSMRLRPRADGPADR
ncbi:MAG: cytochrome P450 [Caldimonas sp.]